MQIPDNIVPKTSSWKIDEFAGSVMAQHVKKIPVEVTEQRPQPRD